MTNLEKYRSLLHDGVQGLLLTSRYSRMYAAEFDIAEGVAVVSAQAPAISPTAAISSRRRRTSRALRSWRSA